MLKLLANQESVDGGVIHWKKGLKIGYLAQIPEYRILSVKECLKKQFEQFVETETKLQQLEVEMGQEHTLLI